MIKPATATVVQTVRKNKRPAASNTDKPVIIFPYPSQGIIRIKTNTSSKTTVDIFDRMGKSILSDELYDEKSFDLSSYADGEYIIRCNTRGHMFTDKILLSK